MIRLRDIERCFRGQVPASIATCSAEGVPNITMLSIVNFVDDDHVALSFQFFNNTRQNVLANPRAQLLVPDPLNFEQYRLDLEYERTEHEGRVFESMRTNLEAVASQTGMSGVFRLQGADIYRVHAIEKLAHDLDVAALEQPGDLVEALDKMLARLGECDDLEGLLDTTLRGLAELFDHPHSMILFVDDTNRQLYTIASHGFERSGVGAEVAIGEGLLGMAAQERRPVRVANLAATRIMADAIRTTARQEGHSFAGREIPLPGLADVQSQLAVPIMARDRTLGVLCVQSAQPGRMTMADEQALATLARYLGTSILLLGHATAEHPAPPDPARPAVSTDVMRIRYHRQDDSVFLDDEYLIKGLPGRILFRLLSTIERDGRTEFSNRELRLDRALQLGGYRDNLEARLILLRQRLDDRTPSLRLVKTGRGRFRLDITRRFVLAIAD